MADLPTTDKTEDPPARQSFAQQAVDACIAAAAWAGYRAYRLAGEGVAIIGALATIVLFLSANMLERQRMDLSALRPNLALWFSQSFDGARADVGALDLEWLPAEQTVRFGASNVVVFDRDGQQLQTLPQLKIISSIDSVRRLRPDLREVEIVGGEVTWKQRKDGTVIAGMGRPDTVGGFGPVYRGQRRSEPGEGLAWLEAFRAIEIRDSRAHIINESNGLSLQLDVENLKGSSVGDMSALALRARVLSEGSAQSDGEIDLTVTSGDNLRTFVAALDVQGIRPDRLAPQTGRASALGTVALPISAQGSAIYNRTDGLRVADIDMSAGDGTLQIAGETRIVEAFGFEAQLTPGEEVMRVDRIDLAAPELSFEGQGVIRQIGRLYDGNIGTSPKFDLTLRKVGLDLSPLFDERLSLAQASVLGQIDLDSRQLDLERFEADFGSFGLSGELLLRTRETGIDQLNLSGRSVGPLSADDLLSIWPPSVADGARRWIERSVQGGQLDRVAYDIALDRAFFDDPVLTSERVQVDFDVSDGIVKYIGTMTPLSDAVASGRIDGNRLELDLSQGRIGNVVLTSGRVDIPRLTPKGGDILIGADAEAPAQSLLRLINEPPFEYLDRYGVTADGFAGQGSITLSVKRPLLEFFDQNRIEYSVNGAFRDASAPFSLGLLTLSDADVSIRGGKEGLFVVGPANLGPWRAQVEWAERYGQNGEPTRYRVSGTMDRKALDGFGLGFRDLFGGTLDVDLRASASGLDIQTAQLDIDMANAELALGDIWSKSIGEAGRFSAEVDRAADALSLPSLRMEAPGLDIAGSARLRDDLALLGARLDRLSIDGLVDGDAVIARNEQDTGFDIQASGRALDISPWVKSALERRGGSLSLPLTAEAMFDTLVLGEGYELDDANLSYAHDGTAVQAVTLRGRRPDGPLNLSLMPSENAPIRVAAVEVPDLSEAASALLGLEATRGGRLVLNADLPPGGEVGAMVGRAELSDFSVSNAPFLAQILSLASLTGLLDTLSGEGLAFDGLEFDFALRDRSLALREARLYGPALGMTGEGDIALDDREIDFSGTLVPAYTANSLLSDIPLIGDVLTGGDGEGIFALTYSVEGPYSGALISINPLSALTPGFLRGIFKRDRKDIPEGLAEEIESVRPPEAD